MDIENKIKQDMRKLGCDSNHKIALAFHLYIYLMDHKLMYDTEYCYNKDIETLYIIARPSKNANLNIYVPVPTTDDLRYLSSIFILPKTNRKMFVSKLCA